MKITDYSKRRIMESAAGWEVSLDYFEPLYNYMIHGWEPGGFWTSVLANDWFGAIVRSHPANQIDALKKASGWITGVWPKEIYGDYSRVRSWTTISDQQRRSILEAADLIYTEEEEVELILRGKYLAPEPVLW